MQGLSDYRLIIISFLLLGCILSCAGRKTDSPKAHALSANSPANASYLIEKQWIKLENGRAEQQAAPGSASKIEIAVFGEATKGLLNNDWGVDAVVFLTFQGGGSGTFFYIAAALQEKGNYRGSNAVWLGDRIASPAAKVQNSLITVAYLDRSHNEPMASAPSYAQTRYFILDNSTLQEIKFAADETIYQGWLTIGHEVRSFQPCDAEDALWLSGESSALSAIIDAYQATMAASPPYTQVFAILAGKTTPMPDNGFGSEYITSLSVSQLIKIWPQGNCRSDFIRIGSPLPGASISSPLIVKGRARGTWFFEGDFPIILLDAQGNRIAQSYATAKEEWMTENFVEFEGKIDFRDTLSGQRGKLILKKDNPTGLPKFDGGLEIPIYFK